MKRFTVVAKRLCLVVFIGGLCLSLPAFAAGDDTLIFSINFDSDTPGLPPATGGADQPTSLFTIGGVGSILVQSSANGIGTQPVVVSQDFSFVFTGLNKDFASVTTGIVRMEATVGFSRLQFARFLATTDTSNGLEVTSLVATLAGNIEEEFTHAVIGTYSPNQPIRVRMDIDLTGKTWSASIDNELNGFEDDPVVSGLPFANVPSSISGVGQLTAYLQVQDGLGSASVAFDDLTALTPAKTPAELLADLLAEVQGVGPGKSLADKVTQAQAFLTAGDVASTCSTLDTFIKEVKAQSGRTIPTSTAATLISDAGQIKSALDC